MINLGILGIHGRMGKEVHKLALKDARFQTVQGKGREDHCDFLKDLDVLIDFSTPDGTKQCLTEILLKKKNLGLVIGTTGLAPEHVDLIKKASSFCPVICSANMSFFVVVLKHVLSFFELPKQDFDIDIVESHHRFKKDHPSGTSLWLRDAFKSKPANIVSLRRGQCFGSHTVYLTTNNEEIAFSHTAFSREPYARGALEAASWLYKKEPGIYRMEDVVGVEDNAKDLKSM